MLQKPRLNEPTGKERLDDFQDSSGTPIDEEFVSPYLTPRQTFLRISEAIVLMMNSLSRTSLILCVIIVNISCEVINLNEQLQNRGTSMIFSRLVYTALFSKIKIFYRSVSAPGGLYQGNQVCLMFATYNFKPKYG